MMWFIFALLCTVLWGGADLFNKMGTDPKDKTSHWRIVIMVGCVMGIHAVFSIIGTGQAYDYMNIIRYLPVSVFYILSMVIGYVGLRYLEVSILSPICNTSGAVSLILCLVVFKEAIAPFQILAIVMIFAGILLLSLLEKKQENKERLTAKQSVDKKYKIGFTAILLPVLYCIIDGIGTLVDTIILDEEAGTDFLGYYMQEEAANIAYELTFFLCALAALFYIIIIKKQKFSFWGERVKGAGALCETAGQFFYIYAIAENPVLAVPIISCYCVFSVIFSRVFIKEKLRAAQYAVVALVIAGIVILGVYDGLAEGSVEEDIPESKHVITAVN